MATTNFAIFDPGLSNAATDSEYATDPVRLVGGLPDGVLPHATFNKFAGQVSVFVAALAEALRAKGISTSDAVWADLVTALGGIKTYSDPPEPTILAVSSSGAVTPGYVDLIEMVDATSGPVVRTLPSSLPANTGAKVTFKKTDASANGVTATLVDFGLSRTITTQNDSMAFIQDAAGHWFQIAASGRGVQRDVTVSRAFAGVYTNVTGTRISVSVYVDTVDTYAFTVEATSGGVLVAGIHSTGGTVSFNVDPGVTYTVAIKAGNPVILSWVEWVW